MYKVDIPTLKRIKRHLDKVSKLLANLENVDEGDLFMEMRKISKENEKLVNFLKKNYDI